MIEFKTKAELLELTQWYQDNDVTKINTDYLEIIKDYIMEAVKYGKTGLYLSHFGHYEGKVDGTEETKLYRAFPYTSEDIRPYRELLHAIEKELKQATDYDVYIETKITCLNTFSVLLIDWSE